MGLLRYPDILDVLLGSEFVRKSRYFLLCQLRGHCSQEKYLFVNQSSELDGFRFIIDTLKL